MGKSQKKKSMRRHNPMRVPDSHLPKGLASASSTSTKNEAILPIIQKMEGPDASDRKWACVAVSNLIQNDSSTRRLLQGKNVVGALITRLTDSEDEVVLEAMGALRNLCIDGGYDICAEMYNKNILTILKTFIPKISNILSQYLEAPKTAPANAQRLVYDFADNVITTLWCLSETSNKALNAINSINLIPFLMSFLASRDRLSIAPVLAAAQCLYVLTDDNDSAGVSLKSNAEYISCLLSIAQSLNQPANGKGKDINDHRLITLRVLSSGILRNISPLPQPSAASVVDIDKDITLPLLQPVISSVKLPEIASRAQQLVDGLALEPQIEKMSLKNTPKSDHKSSSELELEQLEANLRTVQLALEILTGVCATLPDPSAGIEGETEIDDEDEDMADDDEVLDDTNIEDPGYNNDSANPTVLPSLVPSLLSLIQPTSLSFSPLATSSIHPPTTTALSAIHISAMECLNNIFLSLATSPNPSVSADAEGGRKVWNEVWASLGVVGTELGLGQERRKEMWEIGVGVLWGLALVWKGTLSATEEQIQVLIRYSDGASDEITKVKCIGALECLAQYPQSITNNQVIASYLLTLLPTPSSPSPAGVESLMQAVSALIDIYSDETLPYDINFRQGGMLQTLVASVENVRKAVKRIDRKKPGGKDLRRRGEEIRDNLVAFIQYRRNLGLQN
ncbi:armadillo-type protein [Lentinula edodes]|uniref:armadillo-type protein n=1 Tax=Lentinula edodes TaxID=5353 RepID=UPI001E8D86B6|nr:armadillo-type protein [Lentinula edodes]KAH7881058.1 armadillo-type protein [Lentinula edodes]